MTYPGEWVDIYVLNIQKIVKFKSSIELILLAKALTFSKGYMAHYKTAPAVSSF